MDCSRGGAPRRARRSSVGGTGPHGARSGSPTSREAGSSRTATRYGSERTSGNGCAGSSGGSPVSATTKRSGRSAVDRSGRHGRVRAGRERRPTGLLHARAAESGHCGCHGHRPQERPRGGRRNLPDLWGPRRHHGPLRRRARGARLSTRGRGTRRGSARPPRAAPCRSQARRAHRGARAPNVSAGSSHCDTLHSDATDRERRLALDCYRGRIEG